MKIIIEALIEIEETLERKHEILTAIGLATTSEKLFKCCEEVRNELPDCPSQVQVERDDLLRGRHVPYCTESGSGSEKSKAIFGEVV
jgi:hypothetical protein